MKLNQIRDVLAVAQRGSLRSAARHLGLAQPAITRSIRELERELGAPLFERHVTGIALTAVGEAFVRRASAIQTEIQRTKDEVEQLRGNPTGSVTISLSTASHLALLPKVLPGFSDRYPAVTLKIIEGLFPVIESELHSGIIDFYVGPLSEASISGELNSELLFENTRHIVGRKGHPLAAARSLADLTAATWITTAVTVTNEEELTPIFTQHGLPPPRTVIQAQTGLSMIMAVAYSDHLAMLPRQWLDFAAANQLVQSFKLKEEIAAPSIYIVKRARLPLTPVAEHLSDLFRRAALHHSRESSRAGAGGKVRAGR
jgi:LysR family transcriptional regulator of abg operon